MSAADMKSGDDLSTHTISSRKALRHCQEKLRKIAKGDSRRWNESAVQTALDIPLQRDSALHEFWDLKEERSVEELHPSDFHLFQQKFLHRNLPCIIHGLTCFDKAIQQWVRHGEINRSWFLERLQAEAVPVRLLSDGLVDQDGRASECETQPMQLTQYLDLIDGPAISSKYYLKDWHFPKWLEDRSEEPVYTAPELFELDLLNDYLTRFTDGDYRFVYWGPPESNTPKHSDVLHSYSWSFNVSGRKRWTFYPPAGVSRKTPCVVEQPTGTLFFVPSKWQHDVVNLEETLSINHNWITVTNIDCTWECMVAEIKAIRVELRQWGDDLIQSVEAEESMLRGCVGLNTGTFLLMLCTRMLDILDASNSIGWTQQSYEVTRLQRTVDSVLGFCDDLQQRLAVPLASESLGKEMDIMLHEILHVIDCDSR